MPEGKISAKTMKRKKFAYLKSMKKGVGSGVVSGFGVGFGSRAVSGSISQRYGSAVSRYIRFLKK
jgi:hypothetical protein